MGVGLLTNGSAHSASISTDLTPSRASPLPLGIVGDEGFAAGRDQGWEWACSRKGRHIQHQCWLT
ncbi:hypothetical protein C3E98_005055 [Pseudomonas sp. MWU13-2625]|nr:hypothetical protein C3E98_005055 [Pseudomonas sp. MWU13-2625]